MTVWFMQWAKSRSEKNEFDVPIQNFGQVTQTIYRGALPDADGYRGLVAQLKVTRVCSIIERERSQDMRRALGSGIEEWKHIPFSDRDAPAAGKVSEWLDYMRTSETAGAIFTHCRGGRHRTGMLVAVYRVTDCGWTKKQALAEMQRYGWYSALGHQPLLDWFFHEFDPKEFEKK